MKQNIKKYTAILLTGTFLLGYSTPALALSFDILKKNDVKTTSLEKNNKENKNIRLAKLTELNLFKTKQNKDVVQKEENQKTEKKQDETLKEDKQKGEKTSFWEKRKENKQAKKDKEITVTAKTDVAQPSVVLKVADLKYDKEKERKEAENQKHEEVSDEQISEQVDLNNETLDENSKASIEGSVSTNAIISVDDCVKIALENNPNILSQMMSKDIYKNKVAQAWSNYFPSLNAGLSYSRNDMMFTNFRFPMQKYNLYNTPSLGFNQLIYDFGKTSTQANVAKKTYEASQENLQASINDVVYQVKNAYYNLLYLQQQVEVYEDSVSQYEVHLQQAQAYYDIGSKAKIDVSTAKYNLDNTKLTLVSAKNSVDDGFAVLTNAMGTPEIPEFSIKDRLDKKRYDIKFEEALETAYQGRPELMAAKKKMEGSKLLIKASKVAFLPDLKSYGSFSKGGSRPHTDYGYQIGAQLAYSNLNLYLAKKQVDEAKLTFKKDQADYEIQRQKVYLDVKKAFIQLKNAQQSIPVARSSMEVAKERYDLAAGRYKVGLGDAIELKDAQNEYMNAKLQYYNTLMQYHISAANLERVIGAPLETSDVNL